MRVTIWDAELVADTVEDVESVFFINAETHSDEKRLSQRTEGTSVLYVNSKLALAVLTE